MGALQLFLVRHAAEHLQREHHIAEHRLVVEQRGTLK